MENVYLLVTDTHRRDGNLSARYDYALECERVMEALINIIYKYLDQGKRVYIVWVGDIWDRSYADVFEAILENNRMIRLRQAVEGMFSVVGNHELTYYADNPFWTMFTKIESKKVRSIVNRVWQPRGALDVMRIVDEHEDGEVRFILNHYGAPITRAPIDGKVNIGLFHQDLYAKPIVEDMRLSLGLDVFEHHPAYFDSGPVLRGYDYAFFGHMHKMYGKWKWTCPFSGYETLLYYLGSLGRTNHTEVDNKFLERNIPAILVNDGKFSGVEDNKFNLMSREECVREDVVVANQKTREHAKLRKEFASYRAITDDPIQNLRASMAGDPALVKFVDDIRSSGIADLEKDILREFEELMRF